MRPILSELADEYCSEVRQYVREPDEARLSRAYEFGRKALAEGVGVLDTRTRCQALCLCLPAWPSFKAAAIVRRHPVNSRPLGHDARRVKLLVRHVVVALDVVVIDRLAQARALVQVAGIGP